MANQHFPTEEHPVTYKQQPPQHIERLNMQYLEDQVMQRQHFLLERWIKQGSPGRTPEVRQSCIFDGMTAQQCKRALEHYHDHPEQLPDREMPADILTEHPIEVRLNFDQDTLSR